MSEALSFEEILERDGQLVYTNRGVSMKPLLREGRDLMVVRRRGPERAGRLDVVLFKRFVAPDRVDYVLHRVLRVNDDGSYWIVGDNCLSGEKIPEENVLGILTAVIRDGKRTVPVTNLTYRIYSRLWCAWPPFRVTIVRAYRFIRRVWRRLLKRK